MGSLIEVCAQHGISESLVRTAVSRLVSAQRLEGVRVGRRSFYRLSNQAKDEFARASRILFDPPAVPDGWQVALLGPDAEDPRSPWVRVGNASALAPAGAATDIAGAVTFPSPQPIGDLSALARTLWPLDDVAAAYRRFTDRFAQVMNIKETDALALRLRLVDDYRKAALADPRLPESALPADWPAAKARRLFVKLYLDWSATASRQIPSVCESEDGPLPAESQASTEREAGLQQESALR